MDQLRPIVAFCHFVHTLLNYLSGNVCYVLFQCVLVVVTLMCTIAASSLHFHRYLCHLCLCWERPGALRVAKNAL
ncbi:hypothetical protein OSTOST_11055 [Ostertagia ostertagi]